VVFPINKLIQSACRFWWWQLKTKFPRLEM